ncbi:DUF2934 domain-containing protein [Nitrobacter sp. TKz-YC02]|uniref:DUF2934 domain-containing protein n=1 Tax=Nitrobacter sp. TKz-YC02 TaxID=3398704 RepID=UPI003CF2B1BB
MGKPHRAAALAELVRYIAGYSRGPWPTTVPPPSTSSPVGPCALSGSTSEPTQEQIERRSYELWQQAGFPSGRDEEFRRQAKRELRGAFLQV